jgi:hypothetical protein
MCQRKNDGLRDLKRGTVSDIPSCIQEDIWIIASHRGFGLRPFAL